MKLYNVNLSPFASRCRLQIYAKGLESQIEFSDPPDGDLKSPAFLAINPIGKVPALDTGHQSIPESEVICEYLEDRFPEPSLRPQDPEERGRQRVVSRLVDLYTYAALVRLFRQTNPNERDDAEAQEALDDLGTSFDYLEHYVDDDGYAVGDQLTLADCSLVPPLFFTKALLPTFGEDAAAAGSSKLAAYYERMQENEHVARVTRELGVALKERLSADD